jgi:ABC-type amino acid transport substrate-binding protein
LANTEERAKYLDFTSVPLHTTKYGLFALNKDKLLTDDLSNTPIAMLRGVAVPEVIAKKYKLDENNLLRSLSTKDTFELLEKKRVEYAITNYQAGLWYSKEYQNVYARQFNEFTFPTYIAFKRGVIDTKLVDEQIKRFKAQTQ